jgi:cell division protein ZapA
MAEVALQIGGRTYMIACRDGGEAHLLAIAARVDAKVEEARAAAGTASEVRQLLFAALLLADEAQEDTTPSTQDNAATAEALDRLARRIEAVADTLEQSLPTP